MLVPKDDGIVLWLYLALNNVIQGLENVDRETLVRQHAERMPRGIKRLYGDMWSRLNGDETMYGTTYAQIFNFLLARYSLSPVELLCG